MGVAFKEFQVSNRDHPLSVEDLFGFYGAIADIHDFCFSDRNTIVSGEFTGTSGTWVTEETETDIPSSAIVYYSVNTAFHGLSFTMLSDTYQFRATDSGFSIAKNGVQVSAMAYTTPSEGNYTVVADLSTTNEKDYWRRLSFWVNDRYLFSYIDYITAPHGTMTVGLLRYMDAVTYTSFRIPQLCQMAEYGSLDPGEYPASGLSRAIEGRNIAFFIRHNGCLKAFKREGVSVSHTFPKVYASNRERDIASTRSHARMVGAYIWAESVSLAMMAYGHRFEEYNNSMLFTESECLDEAAAQLRRVEEAAFTINADLDFVPLLERTDRVTIDGEDWSIMEQSIDISTDGDVRYQVRAGRYVYG